MKRNSLILLTLILLSFHTPDVFSQNFGRATGRILDKITGAPLQDANVYLANTTIGGSTNKAGRFTIENIPAGKYVMIASIVGYKREHSTLTIESNKTTQLNFEVVKQAIPIDEITVDANSDWEEYYEIFEREMLGQFEFRDSCKILNPKDVSFKMEDGILNATCFDFINIENRALGYNLDILLNKFSWNTDTDLGSYSVYPRFKEMTPVNEVQKATWEKNRKEAFTGSFRHFLYSVVHDSVSLTAFVIYSGNVSNFQFNSATPIKLKDMRISKKENYIELCLDESLMVRNGYLYHLNDSMKRMNLNCILIAYDCLLINYDGVLLNPEVTQIGGYWANQRLADALPYNYRPF